VDSLDGINDILVPQHDQIPDDSPPDLSSDSSSAHQEPFQLSRQFLGLFRITLRHLTNERDEIGEELVIFVFTVLSR
jgi:hypothetical protein